MKKSVIVSNVALLQDAKLHATSGAGSSPGLGPRPARGGAWAARAERGAVRIRYCDGWGMRYECVSVCGCGLMLIVPRDTRQVRTPAPVSHDIFKVQSMTVHARTGDRSWVDEQNYIETREAQLINGTRRLLARRR